MDRPTDLHPTDPPPAALSTALSTPNYRLTPRHIALQILPFLHLLSTIYMSWTLLAIYTQTPTPLMVVSTESMAPGFHRGDVLFVSNRDAGWDVGGVGGKGEGGVEEEGDAGRGRGRVEVRVGEMPVLWLPGRKYPMVHRVVGVWWEGGR